MSQYQHAEKKAIGEHGILSWICAPHTIYIATFNSYEEIEMKILVLQHVQVNGTLQPPDAKPELSSKICSCHTGIEQENCY